MVYGASLAAEDTTFASKASKKMPDVQNWKDHSGNADRGGYIILGCDGLKRPAFVGCTDLTLNAAQIRELYAARFSLEIAIRDLKQHVGFGDYQSTTAIAIDRFVQLCCTAFCIWKVMMLPEDAPTWLDDGKPTAIKESAFSFARARRGLRQFVVRQIFLNSPLTPDLKKVEEEYEPLFRIVS